jgi:hypothetical protein
MGRVRWLLLTLIALVGSGGCSWSDFWTSIAYSANGSGYRRGAENSDYDFQQNYEQQSKAAQEYNQSHQ